MIRNLLLAVAAVTAVAAPVQQLTVDPFPTPIETKTGVVTVKFLEFATLPDVNGEAARMMLLSNEPGTRRIFVHTMRGSLYSISYDGKTVIEYVESARRSWHHLASRRIRSSRSAVPARCDHRPLHLSRVGDAAASQFDDFW